MARKPGKNQPYCFAVTEFATGQFAHYALSIRLMDSTIEEGHYAKKQLRNPFALIRWSHHARFNKALRLAAAFKGQRVLDFGCGDATFLALLADSPNSPAAAVGAEIENGVVESNRKRFASRGTLSFVLQSELTNPEHIGHYDALTCMEVFEHVENQDAYLDLFLKLLRPGGSLLISVPVEIGPAVVLKQAARQIAGWMGAPHYPGVSPYTWGELTRSVCAGSTQHIGRPLHHDPDGFASYCHKGFNWKVLRRKIGSRFEITSIAASPMGWLPPGLNSQVWISARKRP